MNNQLIKIVQANKRKHQKLCILKIMHKHLFIFNFFKSVIKVLPARLFINQRAHLICSLDIKFLVFWISIFQKKSDKFCVTVSLISETLELIYIWTLRHKLENHFIFWKAMLCYDKNLIFRQLYFSLCMFIILSCVVILGAKKGYILLKA